MRPAKLKSGDGHTSAVENTNEPEPAMKVSNFSVLSVILSVLLLFALFGCGGSSGGSLVSGIPAELAAGQESSQATPVQHGIAPLEQPAIGQSQLQDGLTQLCLLYTSPSPRD